MGFSEIHLYKTTRCFIPEDSNVLNQSCWNFKAHFHSVCRLTKTGKATVREADTFHEPIPLCILLMNETTIKIHDRWQKSGWVQTRNWRGNVVTGHPVSRIYGRFHLPVRNEVTIENVWKARRQPSCLISPLIREGAKMVNWKEVPAHTNTPRQSGESTGCRRHFGGWEGGFGSYHSDKTRHPKY